MGRFTSLPLITTLGGLCSAALGIWFVDYMHGSYSLPLAGLCFGAAESLALGWRLIDARRSKLMGFALIGLIAWLLSLGAAVVVQVAMVQLHVESLYVGALDLFVGGFLGAYLMTGACVLLFNPAIPRRMSKVLLSALLGGALAAGSVLTTGPRAPGSVPNTFLLFFLWQPVIGACIGLLLVPKTSLR